MHSFPAVESLLFFPPPEAWQKSRACCAPKIFPYRRDFSRKAGPEGNIIKLKISLPSQALCPPEPALLCSLWTASPSLQEAHVLLWSLLGCPSCENKEREMFSSTGRSAALLLRCAMVNWKCPVWHKPKWLGCLSDKGTNYHLQEMWDRCLENTRWFFEGGEKTPESIWEQHETKFKRTFLFRKNNMSPAATACIVTTEVEDRGHLQSLMPLLFSWLIKLSFSGW